MKRFREAASGASPDVMILDGEHLVDEALRARIGIKCVAVSRSTSRALIDDARTAGAEIFEVTEAVLRAVSPVRTPSGIVALAERPALNLARAFARTPQLAVVAVNVQDPGNVGAIVRAAEAGGATAAVFAGASADPFGWKALRGSMGSAFRLPVVSASLEETFEAGRAAGMRIAGTVARGGRRPYEVDLTAGVAVLLGGEGAGLEEDVVQRADDLITIPMRPPVESLNVAVAAALIVYEASRQREARS